MTVFVNEPIQLGLSLLRNRQPLSGETITVRVINQKTGAELLPLVVVPETAEPGVYNFEWNALNANPPPINVIDMQAHFLIRDETYVRCIELRTKTQNSSDLTAEVFDDNELTGVVTDIDDLQATVGDDSLVAEIDEPTELTAEVIDGDTLTGEIEC